MKKTHSFLTILLIMALVINLNCKKESSCRNCHDSNKPPIAAAGSDQVISLPLDSVLLDGSASSDPDGSITKWLWANISGPASFTITSVTGARTTVKNLAAGTYLFELKVTDNEGLSALDTIQITVNNPGQPNRPPVANAGTDQSINIPANTVTLDGSASTDPDNNIASYAWSKISGPSSFNITNAVAVQTLVTNLVQGVYRFELTVKDSGGLTSRDTCTVLVTPLPSPIILENQIWIFPWYNSIEIENFYTLVPQNATFTISIKRDTNPSWIVVPPISYLNTGPYEYFIETRPDGGGIYHYGSLYIFYYGSDVSDTPDVKIEY